jgi:hypothetical protein
MRHTHLGSQDREVLTRRTSSTSMCGRPEGNNSGGGSVWGWWSAAHGAGRSYSVTRCSGVIESVVERLERAVHGGLAAVVEAAQER